MNRQRSTGLCRDHTQLLIIDIQERLLPAIHEHAALVLQAEKMIRAAGAIGLPVILSEQYPRGLGPTVPAIAGAAQAVAATRGEKMTFSFCADAACRDLLVRAARPTVLLVGMETHVCVQQTALDLLDLGHQPVVLADAVSSRRPLDHAVALDRLRRAGAIVTTVESAIFELIHESGTELFKKILPIVK